MDHVVYVDAKAKEMEKLLSGEKTMIIRGATGRKLPHGRVFAGDVLYLIRNDATGAAEARCTVSDVIHSEKMAKEESIALVKEHAAALQLTTAQHKRWAGKRYLVLISVESVEAIEPIPIDKSNYGNMDDWLPVEDIESVRK